LNVLVLTTRVPFIRGGAEELRDNLVLNLQAAGVQAEAMSLPFTWDPAERLVEEMWIARTIEVANVDRVIALKFPAYLVPHPNKVCWVLHQYRQAYDLFDAGQSNIPDTSRGKTLRNMIRTADNEALGSAQALFTLSSTGQDRIRRYNGLEAQILPQPLNDPDLFAGAEAQGYVFAGGRVGQAKRQALLIQALAYAPDVRMVVAGPPDDATDGPALRALAAQLGVEDRLTLDLRLLPRSEIATLVNGACACAYVPFDEDSVGYVTMEAFQAGKPVVTTTDAGGLLEIVHHEHTGLVAEPTPEALGASLATVVAAPARAVAMGAAGHDLLAERALTWPRTIEKLLA
jgi:glycosyltransferase involved in cell wall biosynthesis